MKEKIPVREAARRGIPLDGADSQALEGALSQAERELEESKFMLSDVLLTAEMLAGSYPFDKPQKRKHNRLFAAAHVLIGSTMADITRSCSHLYHPDAEMEDLRQEVEELREKLEQKNRDQ